MTRHWTGNYNRTQSFIIIPVAFVTLGPAAITVTASAPSAAPIVPAATIAFGTLASKVT